MVGAQDMIVLTHLPFQLSDIYWGPPVDQARQRAPGIPQWRDPGNQEAISPV